MKYNGYTINKRIRYQQTTCYRVVRPNGIPFGELAANIKTAKKWIDYDRQSNAQRVTDTNSDR